MSDLIPSREERLVSALEAAVRTINDYLAYEHSGDPWDEDARAMGEMDINDYGRDGRLDYAIDLLEECKLAAGLSPSQAPATGKADTGLPVNSPKE